MNVIGLGLMLKIEASSAMQTASMGAVRPRRTEVPFARGEKFIYPLHYIY